MPISFNGAYGAGWRAGKAGARLVKKPDGFKYLEPPLERCPFKGRWQILSRHLWLSGWHDGTMQSLNDWLKRRRVA